jgi:hypothetical protein
VYLRETPLQYQPREYQSVTPLDPGAKRKPALDEASFEQVLAAAYVLQQHNDSLRAQDPRLDSGWILTQVAETQSLLRAGGLEPKAANKLIADRLRAMTDSAGVSISLTTNGILRCIAESGTAAKVPGSSLASHSLVATERLRNGRVFQSADAQRDIRLDIGACRELGVRGLLAAPIQQLGEIAGLVEVRWTKPDAVHECDVHTCQLMAGLVTEVLEREGNSPARVAAAPVVDHEPSHSQRATEEEPVKIPEADDPPVPADEEPPLRTTPSEVRSDSVSESPRPAEILATQCRVCGRPFLANEAFCGNCSMPRVTGVPSEDLQSKWASLWYMQQAQDVLEEREEAAESQPLESSQLESQVRERIAWQEQEESQEEEEKQLESVWRRPERVVDPAPKNHQPANTMSLDYGAISPPSWDDMIRAAWKRGSEMVYQRLGRRGAVSALALLLLLAIWSAWPAPASSRLTWFESVLIELGLAQVPSRTPAAPTGNPSVRVWVDVHTALYYCPGSNLYGKTPGGQFESQRSAQQDQFEPATGAVCE